MKKLLFLLITAVGIGAYLHYVLGWDREDVGRYTRSQASLILGEQEKDPRPVGQRGEGIHWEIAERMPIARSEIGAAEIDGKIYVVGGLNAYGRTLADVEVYDIASDTWDTIPRMPQALHHAAVTADNDQLYVMGGYVGIGFQHVDAAFSFSPKTRSWNAMPLLSEFRGAAAGTIVNGAPYIIGGSATSGPTGLVERYMEGEWIQVASLGTPREHLAAVTLNGKIYAIGGRQGGLEYNTASFERYDPATNRWTSLPPLPHPRGGIAAAVLNGKIYIFGGERVGGTFDEIDVYDPSLNLWSTLHLRLPSARHGLAAVAYEDRIYVIGGGEREGYSVSALNEVLVFGEPGKTSE